MKHRARGTARALATGLFLFVASGARGEDPDALVTRAQQAQQDGNAAGAVALYRKFAVAAPQDERLPWILVQIGDLEAGQSHAREALEAYARVGREFPNAVEARMARGRLTQLTESTLEAARTRQQNAKSEDDRFGALMDIAAVHEWTGAPLEAAAAYREIRDQASAASWKAKATARLRAMVDDRIKAELAGPPVPSASRWTEIAELAETAEVWDRAAEYRLKLADLAQDPGDRTALQIKAAHDLELGGKPDRALAICLKAIDAGAKGDQADEAFRTAGQVYENRRQDGEAARLYRRYLDGAQKGDHDAWAHLRLASCLERQGDTAGALKVYGELLAEHANTPEAPQGLLEIGRINEDRKLFDEAKASYQQVIDQYAGSPLVPKARAALQEATARKAEWEKVKDELNHVSEKYPQREHREVR